MSARRLELTTGPACDLRFNCPVRRDARRAVALSQDLGLALKRLRASLRACARCPAGTGCPLRVDLANQVRRAVNETAAELRESG
jgi:methylphosphotriester-DNA--protein-cysteine methyltransferase